MDENWTTTLAMPVVNSNGMSCETVPSGLGAAIEAQVADGRESHPHTEDENGLWHDTVNGAMESLQKEGVRCAESH